MLDEKRVLQVAKEFSMNPDKARKLLEDARSEPAIMKRIHKYEQRVGGGISGIDSVGCKVTNLYSHITREIFVDSNYSCRARSGGG